MIVKGYAALDFDGAVADTNVESYLLVDETWHQVAGGGKYPFSSGEFRSLVRPFITEVGDFFAFTAALMKGEPLQDLDGIRSRYGQIAREGNIAYRRAREVHKQHFDEWIRMMPLFDGVPQMFEQLNSMGVPVWIVSSKDEKTIRDILRANDMERYIYRVLDESHGRRPSQFGEMKNLGIEPGLTVVYDDSSENLGTAAAMGLHAVAAPQGYDLPGRLAPYTKALPTEFPGVVREILNI